LILASALVLVWLGLTVWSFRRWGMRAWPTLLGAPFALFIPLELAGILALGLFGKGSVWMPG